MRTGVWQLAQVNIGIPVEPLDSAQLRDFVDNLEPINALAEGWPGFVWRLQTDDGDATGLRGFGDDRIIVNLTVWEGIDELTDFVFRSDHVALLRRRREFFVRMTEAVTALWWVPAGSIPTIADAEHRLEALRQKGPHQDAFTFRATFAPPRHAEADASIA